MIICDPRNRDALPDVGIPVLEVPLDAPRRPAPPAVELGDTDPAFVLFTSGTSGKPKLVTHGQRYVWGQRVQAEHWLGVRAGELFWSTAAPGWSKSTRNCFIAPWLGGAIALMQDRRFDAHERLATIRAEGVNVLCMAPTEYRMIAADAELADLPSLRRLVTAGEAPGVAVVEDWENRTGLRIADGYGQTETGHVTSVRPGEIAPAGSMGRPLPGVRVSIVDGELMVDPASLPTFFLGYDRQPAPDGLWADWRPRSPGRGRLPLLRVTGRRRDLVGSGYRIGPEEVEAALDQHPAVRECAAIGVPDERRGELVCAVVALHAGHEPSEHLIAELIAFVRERTAPYKAPRVIRFVDGLPRTSSGKIIRSALRSGSNEVARTLYCSQIEGGRAPIR